MDFHGYELAYIRSRGNFSKISSSERRRSRQREIRNSEGSSSVNEIRFVTEQRLVSTRWRLLRYREEDISNPEPCAVTKRRRYQRQREYSVHYTFNKVAKLILNQEHRDLNSAVGEKHIPWVSKHSTWNSRIIFGKRKFYTFERRKTEGFKSRDRMRYKGKGLYSTFCPQQKHIPFMFSKYEHAR
jgi:hypothetical protein